MLNSECFVVARAYHSTCSQGYPQKMGKKGGIFTALPLCGNGGRAVVGRRTGHCAIPSIEQCHALAIYLFWDRCHIATLKDISCGLADQDCTSLSVNPI